MNAMNRLMLSAAVAAWGAGAVLADAPARATAVSEFPDLSPAAETAANAIDGQTGSKWLFFSKRCALTVALPEPAQAVRYSVTSANDEKPRDPKAWTLLASEDGVKFVELDRQRNVDFRGRFEKRSWPIAKPGTWRYYRLAIEANGGGVDRDKTRACTQLAEFDLLNDEGVSILRRPRRIEAAELPDWAFGPFVRPAGVNPVIAPNPASVFDCPMRKRPLKWEESDTFNPAATVKDGRIVVLYRAEDNTFKGVGSRTSRLGYAESDDGSTFSRAPAPVLYPCEDAFKDLDWEGGCEDPRLAMTEDGLYVLTYTSWNKKVPRLSIATSRDLRNWTKHGLAFGKADGGKHANRGSKSAAIVQAPSAKDPTRYVITKVNGKYLMYWGEACAEVATSDNLIDWQPLGVAMTPREGHFDSALTEVGPAALLTEKGILVFYNGKNRSDAKADPDYPYGVYCAGQALFDRNEPKKLLARLDRPYFCPEADFERTGQYKDGTVFTEGLVFFKGKWHLYYGCADSFVGYATWNPSRREPKAKSKAKVKAKMESKAVEKTRAAERDVLALRGAWRMGQGDALALGGREVSSASFDDSAWLPATVPGTVLTTLVRNGRQPDPYWGLNNRRNLKIIPDLFDAGQEFYTAWFRTEFDVPADYEGRNVWIRPEGINYRGELWLNGHPVGMTAGMFRRPAFCVTDLVKPGRRNVLAVKVRPPDIPGDPRPKPPGKEWGAAGEWRNGGNGDIGMNVTMLMSIGWDFTFSDGIRDRNTGIWRDITLFTTGRTRLADPFVRTKFVDGRHDRVELTAEVTVDNYACRGSTGQFVTFEVEGTPIRQRGHIGVARGECRTKTFTATIDNPKLWWPRNKGGQNLYTAVFTAYSDQKGHEDEVIDRVRVRFGVREVASTGGKGADGKMHDRQFYANGRKVFVRGTNWIPEAMLKTDDARMEAEIRLLAESGVNLVRLWGGGIAESDRFYELCDEYGLMVWQEFFMSGDTAHPMDRELYLANVADTVRRIRPHASVVHYVCSNESSETTGIRELIQRLDPTRSYMPSSETEGVHDGSPYKVVNPMRYYEDTASDRGSRICGFNPEYGTCALPDAEYLRSFMPEDLLWPMNKDAWRYREGGGFDDMTSVHDTLVNAYGKAATLDDYCRKSEAVDAMNHRALWEAWNRATATRHATGVLFWYANTPVPKIGSHAWDHSLGLTAAFFAQKSALAPLHAQYDYLDNAVSLMNDTPEVRNVEVTAEVYDFNSKRLSAKTVKATAAAETCADLFTLALPANLTPVHFIRLAVKENGKEVDSTVYWRSTSAYSGPKKMDGPATAGFESLEDLPKATLDVKTAKTAKGLAFTVENTGKFLAFLTKIQILDAAGRQLKPAFYTDNWLILMPGETKTVEAEFPSGAASWTVRPWNGRTVKGSF